MTDRLRLDQHTDDTLTELYDQLDQARDIAVRLEQECAHTTAQLTEAREWETHAIENAKRAVEDMMQTCANHDRLRAEAEAERDQLRAVLERTQNRAADLATERDQHAALLRRTEQYLAATHQYIARHDVLGENLGCAGCDLLSRIRTALADPAPDTAAEGSTPC